MHAADVDEWREAVKNVLHMVRSISPALRSADRNHKLFNSIHCSFSVSSHHHHRPGTVSRVKSTAMMFQHNMSYRLVVDLM